MINRLLCAFVRSLLWLRYRIRVRGMKEVSARGRKGILFLPNHPALIDPIIVLSRLLGRFRPLSLADRDQVDRFFIRFLARRIGVLAVPDLGKYGPSVRQEVRRALRTCIERLKSGGNLVLWPAGHLYRTRYENLRGNSAVEAILREISDVRVVLVRTRGLWGSTLSLASGYVPNVAKVMRRGAAAILANGIFFTPRRNVTIDLHEPDAFPRQAGRNELNRFMEDYYNEDAPPNTCVPYTIWRRRGSGVRPEPQPARSAGNVENVPDATRRRVIEYLGERTGVSGISADSHLARDLGLDSLARAELIAWLEDQFGFPQGDTDSLVTAGDVMLAAAGESIYARLTELEPVPSKWFPRARRGRRLVPAEGLASMTILQAFLRQAGRAPGRVLLADGSAGAKTNRDVITAVMLLAPRIEQLDGERIGIMMPASVAASLLYISALFAGKVPVMLNWTLGRRNMAHCMALADVRCVLTSGALVDGLKARGVELDFLCGKFVFLEDLAGRLGTAAKLKAWVLARISWRSLRRSAEAPAAATAVVLFTSGSESLPKAVPLTHANMLANVRDMLSAVTLFEDDSVVAILPPFHSFGLTVTVVLPLCASLRAVYQADPTQASMLSRVIESYQATLLVTTPTFLGGLLRTSSTARLASLRMAVTGAESCPRSTRDALADQCPDATILEGYGATECSPIISINDENAPRPLTVGKVLPSLEHVVVDVETNVRLPVGQTGMLLVRGPSVFDGYLGYEGASPFVEFDGGLWYRTGDLVSEDADGVLTFKGRLKRFVKLGGEMISLPAVEAALEGHYPADADGMATIAVEATPDEFHPEIVLFAACDADRETANRRLRDAGFSPIHNVSRVVRLDGIPLLGTGKTDYRALKDLLRDEDS